MSKCDTCIYKEECKANMKAYGVPFVRIDECREYESEVTNEQD